MQIMINVISFAEIIINMIIRYHNLSNFIVSVRELLFTLKFQSLLY